MLIMTSKEYIYSLHVTANKFGIRYLSKTSVYQRGYMIFPCTTSEGRLQLLYNMSGKEVISLDDLLQMDIPDEYQGDIFPQIC